MLFKLRVDELSVKGSQRDELKETLVGKESKDKQMTCNIR